MVPRTIQLLHVEDSQVQRRFVAQHLAAMPDFTFTATYCESEEDAVEHFARGRFDLVIMDYHLTEGNGLSCLHRLRLQDPVVPIIAVSGAAAAATAAELLRAGADDYIAKEALNAEVLFQAVRTSLARATAIRQQIPTGAPKRAPRSEALFEKTCRAFASCIGPGFFRMLDEFQAAARQENVTSEDVRRLFEKICSEPQATDTPGDLPAQRLLRPVLLEALFGLFSELGSSPQRARRGSTIIRPPQP